MKLNKSKLSIIISVLNARTVIENCIISILNQNYKSFELIIIDGGSTDGTVEILESYSDKISFWISEKDTGIYNAWNKALVRASGEWICFIGSDDILLPNSLTKLMAKAEYPVVNFVSSRAMLVNNDGVEVRAIGKALSFQNISRGFGVVHCGALNHHTLFKEYGFFNDTYKIAGDIEFLLRVGINIKGYFLNEITLNMGNTGVSNSNKNASIFESSKLLYLDSKFGMYYGVKFFFFAHLSNIISILLLILPFGKNIFLRNK